MYVEFEFKTSEEMKNIIEENKGMYLISIKYLLDNKNVICFSTVPTIEQHIIEQSNRISILEEENSKLLLDNAKKEIEINNTNKNIANVTLEIAKIKIEGAV